MSKETEGAGHIEGNINLAKEKAKKIESRNNNPVSPERVAKNIDEATFAGKAVSLNEHTGQVYFYTVGHRQPTVLDDILSKTTPDIVKKTVAKNIANKYIKELSSGNATDDLVLKSNLEDIAKVLKSLGDKVTLFNLQMAVAKNPALNSTENLVGKIENIINTNDDAYKGKNKKASSGYSGNVEKKLF